MCGQNYKHVIQLSECVMLLYFQDKFKKNTCLTCGKSFKDKQGLKVHMKRIHMPRKFGCDYCGQRFQQRFNLTRHLKSRHPESMTSYGVDNFSVFGLLANANLISAENRTVASDKDLAPFVNENISDISVTANTHISSIEGNRPRGAIQNENQDRNNSKSLPVFPVPEAIEDGKHS